MRLKQFDSLGLQVSCVQVCYAACPTLCEPMDCSLTGSCLWDSPHKNTGVSCHALLRGIFLTQGLNQSLMFPELAEGFFTSSATWEAPAGVREQI